MRMPRPHLLQAGDNLKHECVQPACGGAFAPQQPNAPLEFRHRRPDRHSRHQQPEDHDAQHPTGAAETGRVAHSPFFSNHRNNTTTPAAKGSAITQCDTPSASDRPILPKSFHASTVALHIGYSSA